jgi:hypothetical protein
MRLKAALSRGIPVAVTCGRPAETSSILTIESRRQRERSEDLHNHGIPGISNSDILTFAKTKFRVLLGVEREPPYHTSVDSGKVVTAVR